MIGGSEYADNSLLIFEVMQAAKYFVKFAIRATVYIIDQLTSSQCLVELAPYCL